MILKLHTQLSPKYNRKTSAEKPRRTRKNMGDIKKEPTAIKLDFEKVELDRSEAG